MLKITFIVESLDVGGTELSLWKWLRHAQQNKFTASVISLRNGGLKKEFEQLGVEVVVIPKANAFDFTFLRMLIRVLKDMRPDVVHCRNGIPVISYGVVAARWLRIPVVSSIHGRTHYLNISWRTRLWFMILRLSQVIITVTEGIKLELTKLAGVAPNKIKVIYNGIDLNSGLEANAERIRSQYALSKEDFIVGTVGNLRSIKGHAYLIEAMAEVLKIKPNAKLVLIGKGEEEANLKKIVSQLNIEPAVKFLGFQADAQSLISMFDVFVLSSLSEGFPNVILEAMKARVAIVATNVGGVGEILKDQETAILVPPADKTALAQGILKLAGDHLLREKFSNRAYQHLQANFGIEQTFRKYDDAYLYVSTQSSNILGEI